MNMSEDWENSITTPELMWRPDFQDPGTYYTYTSGVGDRIWVTEMPYPWLYSYPDVGLQYKDFVARVNVEGVNAAGTEYYGWGRLTPAAIRRTCGEREVTVDTWIDNETECLVQARRLMAYQCDPSYLKMKQVKFNTEHLYRTYLADYTAAQSQYALISLAGGMPGDVVTPRYPFPGAHATAADWPAHAPSLGALYENIRQLWETPLVYDGTTYTAFSHVIRTFTRTFTPTGGWDVTIGVEPATANVRGTAVTDNGSGTY
jgi:hypothetical protein